MLLGGTGAVGTVIADCLIRAGQHVTLLLKSKHAERLQRKRYGDTPASLALYDHNKRQQARLLTPTIIFAVSFAVLVLMYNKSLLLSLSLAFLVFFASFVSLPYSTAPFRVINNFQVATVSSNEPATTDCDYLWLCIAASDIQQHSTELAELLTSLPPHVIVITVSPLSNVLLRLFPHPYRLAQCMCAFTAYQAPLMGEEVPSTHQLTADMGGLPQGVARYFPPLTSSTLYGRNQSTVQQLVRTLRAGGLPVAASSRPSQQLVSVALFVAVFHPLLLGMELAGWSLSQLFSPAHRPTISLVLHSILELLPASFPRPLRLLLSTVLSAAVLRGVLFVSMSWLPFDGEAYLIFHGTKISDQTLEVVRGMEEAGGKEGRQMEATRKLRQRVEKQRGEQSGRLTAGSIIT